MQKPGDLLQDQVTLALQTSRSPSTLFTAGRLEDWLPFQPPTAGKWQAWPRVLMEWQPSPGPSGSDNPGSPHQPRQRRRRQPWTGGDWVGFAGAAFDLQISTEQSSPRPDRRPGATESSGRQRRGRPGIAGKAQSPAMPTVCPQDGCGVLVRKREGGREREKEREIDSPLCHAHVKSLGKKDQFFPGGTIAEGREVARRRTRVGHGGKPSRGRYDSPA